MFTIPFQIKRGTLKSGCIPEWHHVGEGRERHYVTHSTCRPECNWGEQATRGLAWPQCHPHCISARITRIRGSGIRCRITREMLLNSHECFKTYDCSWMIKMAIDIWHLQTCRRFTLYECKGDHINTNRRERPVYEWLIQWTNEMI